MDVAEQKRTEVREWAAQENTRLTQVIRELNRENDRYQMRLTTADGGVLWQVQKQGG